MVIATPPAIDTLGLDEVPAGRTAAVVELRAGGLLRRRLLDLGLVPGARVEALHTSLAGDPRAYRLRQTTIALRHRDAADILVCLEQE